MSLDPSSATICDVKTSAGCMRLEGSELNQIWIPNFGDSLKVTSSPSGLTIVSCIYNDNGGDPTVTIGFSGTIISTRIISTSWSIRWNDERRVPNTIHLHNDVYITLSDFGDPSVDAGSDVCVFDGSLPVYTESGLPLAAFSTELVEDEG